MLVNLHRPLGSFKFQFPLLKGQLNLLSEDFALIHTMRRGVVPFAVLHILKLLFRWYLVIWL